MGKEILRISWEFVLDAWTCRNEIEHDKERDPTKRKGTNL
jgi:hypothetical protein